VEGQLAEHRGQSYYYRHSEASIKEMRSHTVVLQPTTTSCNSDKADPWPYFLVGDTKRCFRIERNQKSKCGEDKPGEGLAESEAHAAWNDTPFYVIGVPKTLIPSHTDIFQEGTEQLLIAIANHYETFASPTIMKSTAKSPGR
jgi:hypothetical protein